MLVLLASTAVAQENALSPLHDPCIIRGGDTYYVFCTGRGVPVRTSKDLVNWKRDGTVMDKLPAWVADVVPGANSFWAPDIIFANGEYRLYYSVSTFGVNQSAIGLAVTKSLDRADPNYGWTDRGMVISSTKADNFNAIDAAVMTDVDGRAWMALGSFWSGIKLIELDPATGLRKADDRIRPIARRPEPPNAIEAPFLTRRGEWYYLWVSFDRCCQGTRSTYNVRVGRSRSVEGPYVDRQGLPLIAGGGTPVLAGSGDIRGPGHNAVLQDGPNEYLVHHFYNATNNGRPTLQVRPLTYDADGWPIAGGPITPVPTGPGTQPATQATSQPATQASP
ncbi:MAG TPA: arabinan endo-1,5-alpha-L-arabinosidase [Tepidisphaeraceae bacterium]|jgi:arabinan endo-1,5-alpha-L-arabinosidase